MLHGFVKIDTWISVSCYKDFSKLFHGFLFKSFYMDLSNLLHGFVEVLYALNQPKYSMPWVDCAFANVVSVLMLILVGSTEVAIRRTNAKLGITN